MISSRPYEILPPYRGAIMTKERILARIEKEFATAAAAKKQGNDGMVRVCARRAAGTAISFWLQMHPGNRWGVDAMNQLRQLQADLAIPDDVRAAAMRLTMKITSSFTSPSSTDPITDSTIIIRYLLK